MKTLLIKNGTVVTATDKYIADVFISGEKIQAIGKDLDFNFKSKIRPKKLFLFYPFNFFHFNPIHSL